MTRSWQRAALVPLLAVLASCNPISVRYDADRGAALASFKTFNWVAAAPAPAPPAQGARTGWRSNSIMEGRVRRMVEQELTARGYRLDPGGNPDFLLNSYPVYQVREVESYNPGGPLGGYGHPWGDSTVVVHHFREGNLVLAVLDPRTSRVLWQAVAEGALTGLRDPQGADAQVQRAVRKMLAKFPPPPLR